MNQSDIRMGWPAALNCIPLEPRKEHVTPPRTKPASIAFFVGESTNQDIDKFYGAAQAPQGAEPATAAANQAEAAPPSTTDKPQGVWVKTSERKPPDGSRKMTRGGGYVEGLRLFLGGLWRGHNDDQYTVRAQGLEWLDETPQAAA